MQMLESLLKVSYSQAYTFDPLHLVSKDYHWLPNQIIDS
jgi:hypothetical protein